MKRFLPLLLLVGCAGTELLFNISGPIQDREPTRYANSAYEEERGIPDRFSVGVSVPIGGAKPVHVVNQPAHSVVVGMPDVHEKAPEASPEASGGGVSLPGVLSIEKGTDPNLVAAVALVILAVAVLLGVRVWVRRRQSQKEEPDSPAND